MGVQLETSCHSVCTFSIVPIYHYHWLLGFHWL